MGLISDGRMPQQTDRSAAARGSRTVTADCGGKDRRGHIREQVGKFGGDVIARLLCRHFERASNAAEQRSAGFRMILQIGPCRVETRVANIAAIGKTMPDIARPSAIAVAATGSSTCATSTLPVAIKSGKVVMAALSAISSCDGSIPARVRSSRKVIHGVGTSSAIAIR